MRAWRLTWPPGFKLFEVDSAAVLSFKSRVLAAAGPELSVGLLVDRVEVVADAAQPQGKQDHSAAPRGCRLQVNGWHHLL